MSDAVIDVIIMTTYPVNSTYLRLCLLRDLCREVGLTCTFVFLEDVASNS